MKKTLFVNAALSVTILILAGCDPTLPPATPGGTFTMLTAFQPQFGLSYPVPGVSLSATWVPPDLPGAQGSAAPLSGVTNGAGLIAFLGARAPATWKFYWLSPLPVPGCRGISATGTVSAPQAAERFTCYEIDLPPVFSPFNLSISPGTINLARPPTMMTVDSSVTGTFNHQYGAPQTQYIDSNGTIAGIAYAASISSDGSSITGSTPGLGGVALGSYNGLGGNVGSGNSFQVRGYGKIGVIDQCTGRCGPR